MVMAFRKKYWIKYFNHSLLPKPTGQGTGLGLSMSYDIVKAHGGELKVETKEGEGSAVYYFSSGPLIFFELCDQIEPDGK
jgi:light-regulated signal transduction histidine kinase (bacteriophytochrome)